MNQEIEKLLNSMYDLSKDSPHHIVDMDKFLNLYPDSQELRNNLKTLEDIGMISLVESSGIIFSIHVLQKAIDHLT